MPIGRPVGARCAYVLDASLNLVPQGCAGELYLGGALLARGYNNRSGLTAERFIADPFNSKGGRLYRTGDLVWWNNEGQLEYLGRIDLQVKIRGFRIELGEVEARLLAEEEVREAVVVSDAGPGGARLVGYVSLHAGHEVDGNALRERLSRVLPEYMVPSVVMVLDALPLNANGKIDRKALPKPEFGDQDQYEVPIGEAEETLASIWAEVLNVPRIGRTDNFFALGGDSILSLKVISKAKATGHPALNLKLRDLMLNPTIAALLDRGGAGESIVLLNAPVQDAPPLFCIHPGMGGIFDYRSLAERLQGKRSVYGLACPMLRDMSRRYASLAEMADDYTAMLLRAQPQGAYHLLGWSLGGALAVMIAARLEACGREVAFLGLLDTSIPGQEETPADPVHANWKEDFRNQLPLVLPDFNLDLAQLPDLEDCEDVEAMRRVLADVTDEAQKQGFSRNETYAALDIEDMARLFIVGRRLSLLLDQAPRLPQVRVAPHCWWAENTPDSAKTMLGEHLGCGSATIGRQTASSHGRIVYDEDALAEIAALLA
jgi:thioesterase domain-containing protein